jgi:glycosyltransferase involved in cell wall biosynthesis
MHPVQFCIAAVKILMIAPEPFFEPRGTPFSEFHRIRALVELGHTVDLVTYPFGTDVDIPGLRVFRSLRPPFIRKVRIGPSLAKVPLDLLLAATAIRRAWSGRYDAVHSHEEGSFIGVLLAGTLGIPHLYDMHSSLPQQLTNFGFSRSPVLAAIFSWLERAVIRRSRVVIVICPHLQETVRAIDARARTVLIENSPGSGDVPVPGSGARVRAALGLAADAPIVLYTGTFEAYQGLDLLFAAAAHVRAAAADVRFVLAGGRPDQIDRARRQAQDAGAGDVVVFAGQRPAEEIPEFLDAADVLVSPRSSGTNTPLKIYQYLRSGRPIVATRLLTHTQVLDDDVAFLAEATPAGMGDAILRALRDPALARRVAERARCLAETRYSYDTYLQRTREACGYLTGEAAAQAVRGVA